jgi:ubiquinone biosynthesis protein
MIGLRRAARLARINRVLVRHGLDELVLATHLYRPLRFLFALLPWNWGPRRGGPRGVRLREALEELGPIFVKFGQIVSTRRDLLPDDIADELAKLQDAVPPFPGAEARRIVEAAYGRPVEQVFSRFEERPLASASIAQVHAAVLQDGSEVVVKVLRPQVRRVIERDLALLRALAALAERYSGEARRLRPREVVAEMEKTLWDELDLVREGANASLQRRHFEDSPMLYVPRIYWDYTRAEVLVMERVYGTPVGDVQALKEQGIDMKRLAEYGVEIFFTQVFRHNFFHADMHPGNIFVAPDGRYISVDFGIMGSLDEADRRYLAETLLGFFRRDYRRVAEAYLHAGWVGPEFPLQDLEAAVRTVSEPIFQRSFDQISFGRLLVRLFQVARRFNLRVQPQLVLLQKTLLNIEGLGRQLYPQLDLWATAHPFMEVWMRERVGPRAVMERVRDNAPRLGMALSELPLLQQEVLTRLREGDLQVRLGAEAMASLGEEIRAANRRTVIAVAGAALWIGAALLAAAGLEPGEGPRALFAGLSGAVLGLAAAGLGLLILAGWRGRPKRA